MYAAWHTGGGSGLIAVKAVLTLVVLWIVARQLSATRMSSPLMALLLFCAIAGIWARVYVFRPQVFSLVLFAILLAILRGAAEGRGRRLWLLPPMFALWANLHGGWLVGLGTLAVWSATNLGAWRSARVPAAALIGVGLASLAATLANPYGTYLWSFVAETVRFERTSIADWQPLFDAGPGKIVPWAISAAFTCLALVHRAPPVPLSYAVLTIGLGLASLRVSRLDAFFALAVVILLAPQIASFVEGPARTGSSPARAPRLRLTWIVPAVVSALLTIALVPQEFRCVRLDGPWMPEREAGALIREMQLHGRLLTWFDWGQYAIWHFSPALQVSFDGRRETVYSNAYINQHTALYFDPASERRFLDQLKPDHAWLARDLPLVAELERRGWTRVFTGSRSVVLSQRAARAVTPSQIRTPACFPGP